jgi:hypothetical protein
MKRIENDEQYFKSLEWLVQRSQVLANPLVDPAEKARVRGLYDLVEHECLRYRMPHMFQDGKKALEELF